MKKHKLIITAIASIVAAGTTFADIPNTTTPKTYLGTIIHATYADLFNETMQYAINLEGGVNQQRIGMSGGYKADKFQRFKLYGEFLNQNIGFPYFSGNTHQNVGQTSLDFRYQYKYVDTSYKPSVDLAGYMSNSVNTMLRTNTGVYAPGGVSTPYSNQRRIAGAFSQGLVADFGLALWKDNNTGIGVNYDDVRYDNEFQNYVNSSGLGGGLFFSQIFKDFFTVNAVADWRQPYNYYSFNAGFTNMQSKGTWTIGGEWNYVRGKDTLPSTFSVGLVINYWPEMCNVKTLADRREKDDLLRWIQQPAVVTPQALAIPDQLTT